MDKLRKDCWNSAFHSFGTAYIFRRKAEKYKKRTSLLKIFGIAVPVSIGATVLGYGIDTEILKGVLYIAAPLTFIQLLISVIAAVQKWDEELFYAYESASENLGIALSYESLGKYPPNEYSILEKEIEILKAKQRSRDSQDDKHSITEKEERMGMRYSSRNYNKECTGCNQIPKSMKPTSCNICGNF